MNGFTFNEYQDLARRTQNKDLSVSDRQKHALFGLCAEVGEIHSLFQKVYQGHQMDLNKLESECGDCAWFLAELADAFGFKLSDIAFNNIAKLRRRYPDGFSEERSVNRAE